MDRHALLKEITEAPGLPGYETEVRKVMKRYLEPVSTVSTDRLGSVIGEKTGKSGRPRIMIAGHMDELGYMVTLIEKNGYLRFQTLGGWLDQVIYSQRVTVHAKTGEFPGIIGAKPPHITPQEDRKKMIDRKEMFIDIGAQSKEEVLAWGIKPGDPIVPFSPYTPLHNKKMVMAKAWDDRFACAAGIEILYALQDKAHPNTVFTVGTVQEEVGLRGAQTSSYVVDPDVGICLDVGFAGDYPGISERDALGKVGQGPMITIYDSSAIPNVKLRELVIATAEECKIPYQYDYNPGGTDTGRIQLNRAGVPSINIGVPTRYQHSPFSVINLDDYDNTVKLVAEIIMRLDATTVASLVD